MGVYWFILVALLIVSGQAYLFKQFGLKHIHYARDFSKHAVYAGDELELVEVIENRGWLLLPWLRLESNIDARLKFRAATDLDIRGDDTFQKHKSFFSLTPYTKVRRRHYVTATRRGFYQLKTCTLTSGDLLGLMKQHRTEHMDCHLAVYPVPVPIEEVPLPSHSWQGDVVVRRWIVEDPFMIQGTRTYQSGDPLNAINWKATARTNTFQVHHRDFTADHNLRVYLNIEEDANMWRDVTDPERIEQGIVYAASIVNHALNRGITTGFGCNGVWVNETDTTKTIRVQPGRGQLHLHAILETMARIKLQRSLAFHAFLEEDIKAGVTNQDILILTTHVSEVVSENVETLRHMGNAVQVLQLKNDRQETEDDANGAAVETRAHDHAVQSG